MVRKNNPNILVTGTLGTGKSKLCEILAKKLCLNYFNLSDLARNLNFVKGYHQMFECDIVDHDMMLDFLKPIMGKGGNILEYHACELFPADWFDCVLVLRCNNTVLYDRVTARNYSENKVGMIIVEEVVDSILEDAKGRYRPDIIFELKNETEEDLKANEQKVKEWYYNWKAANEYKLVVSI